MKMPKGVKEIMFVQDGAGNKHTIYGDDFAAAALLDALTKLNELEVEKAQREKQVS